MSGAATLHATAVAMAGRVLLIIGRSGSGKSSLALEMIALGAELVADDVVRVRRVGDDVVAAPVRPGADLIEARGVGLLRAPVAAEGPVRLVIDLERETGEWLPEPLKWEHDGASAPLLRRPAVLRPAALRLALLSGGPVEPALASEPTPDQSCALRARVGAAGANGVS